MAKNKSPNSLDDIPSRSGFFPINSLDGKNNYKLYFMIDRDGSISKSVFLHVTDQRLREQIILLHFVRHYVKYIFQETVGMNIVERDNPWDFRVQFSNEISFNIEIVAIADNERLFSVNKAEERLDAISSMATIPFGIAKKIFSYFPSDEVLECIRKAESDGADRDTYIKNPWHLDGKRLFLSSWPEADRSLFELIRDAIALKESKKHEDKFDTILVIDNRTSRFDIHAFHEASKHFDDVRPSFRQIWLYTGYYSDDDGNNCEFALVPIRAPQFVYEQTSRMIDELGLAADGNGIVYQKD